MHFFRKVSWTLVCSLSFCGHVGLAQQVSGQDIDKILERADKLLDEAKTGYEEASSKASVTGFVDAGFKLEEARIKYLVLQEIGSAEKQKLAADRLRAVNQLAKLIHDAKVAVGGTPAEPTPAKPIDPAPNAKNPPANPPVQPKAADVSKREPIPDAAKQREAEKLIKDLFKDQYGKKAPEDRKALARLLLEQSGKPQEDPAILWILCREAQDVATQVCDVRTLSTAIDTTARVFDVDAMLLRNGALTAAGKVAKTPEEIADLTEALFMQVDDLMRADQYESAERIVTLATQLARKSADAFLTSRSTIRSKEVAEAKSLFQSMKSVLETQAKNPDDPSANLEIGKFLCFVKGSWDLGLRFIVKGPDTSLKSLAEKELALPAQSAERIPLADGWYELADKDKSPLRKSQLMAHAKVIYESALPEAKGVVRARIEKRLGEIESTGSKISIAGRLITFQSQEQLKLFLVAGGAWNVRDGELVGTCQGAAHWATLSTAFSSISQITLRARIVPPGKTELRIFAGPIHIIFNWSGANENHYRNGSPNSTKTSPHVLIPGKEQEIVLRQNGKLITVTVDGKKEYETEGQLAGTVSIAGASGSTVAFRSLRIDGKPDPTRKVTAETRDIP